MDQLITISTLCREDGSICVQEWPGMNAETVERLFSTVMFTGETLTLETY